LQALVRSSYLRVSGMP